VQIIFRGGPRAGQTNETDLLPAVIGDGTEGGVYQRTEEAESGAAIYAWQPLTPEEAHMLVNRRSPAE